jgi:undecaprenyl-diphosphatase
MRFLVASAVLLFGGFLVIAVLAGSDWLTAMETRWVRSVVGWRSPTLTSVMQGVSWLGTGWFEFPFVLLAVGVLWLKDRVGDGIRYFLWGLGGWSVYAALKLIIHRPRPSGVEWLSGHGWHSFPSGHAMLAPILFVFAAVLLTTEPRFHRFRIPALGLAWTVCFLMAISRVYLGVHYPSDVVAGLLAGSAWMALSLAVSGKPSQPAAVGRSNTP